MNNLKIPLFALVFYCASLAAAPAQLYRYNFIITATSANTYPLSDYAGIYMDLTAPSGVNVDYGSAIADWNFPTGEGTINHFDSGEFSYGGPAVMSWNSSTITSFGNTLGFQLNQSYGPAAYPWPGNTAVTVSYYVGNNTYSSDGLFGYWQAEPVPVPEPATFWLFLALLAGSVLIRQKAPRRSQPAGMQ